jgi:antitoxin component HigA of HigAB toxin-antitoxin module
MEIKPIKTKADHRAALKEVEGLMSAGKGPRDGERLDVLVTLIEAYERKHFPMELPDPIEAIRFSMEQKGLTAKECHFRNTNTLALAWSTLLEKRKGEFIMCAASQWLRS